MLLLLGLLLLGVGLAQPRTAPAQPDAATDRVLRVGVLAFRDHWSTLARWQPTGEYLSKQIAGYRFEFNTYDLASLRNALHRGELDFVFTNTGHYIELDALYGLAPLATVVNRYHGQSLTRFGAVIFTRADRTDIEVIADLRGRQFAAVGRDAFGGFQMAWYEFLQHGIDPLRDLASVQWIGLPQDQIVLSVRDGLVDAGTVRTGVLERLAESGKIRLEEFKVLAPRTGDGFPFLRSTALYPEWPLARASHTPDELGKAVANALFALGPHSDPARQARIAGWTVPLDYAPAQKLMQMLQVGPYTRSHGAGFVSTTGMFALWLAAGLAVLLLAWAISRSAKARARAANSAD